MRKRMGLRAQQALYNAIGRSLARAAKEPVTPALPQQPEPGNSAVTGPGLSSQRIGRGMRVTGCIRLDILKSDVKHNGQLQALADLAEARRTGVKLTPEAEEYAREICSGTGYPMRDSDW